MKKFENLLKERVIKASREVPEDVEKKIRDAYKSEEKGEAKIVLKAILDNIDAAKETSLPLCQDTGLFWVLIRYAKDSPYSLSDLIESVKRALALAQEEGYFRKSAVKEPVFDRINTKNNLPSLINIELIEGKESSVDVLLKGFGSENCSSVRMINPTAGPDGVIDAVIDMIKAAGGKPCPPMFLGIGIGGTLDRAAFLSKKALIEKAEHQDSRYSLLEEKILQKANELAIGAGGLGGSHTALEANILYESTHIAGLPVALSVSCWADRKARVSIGEELWKED